MSPGIFSAGPGASDIMIKRYDVQDAERYKWDHRLLIVSAIFTGMEGGLVGAAGIIMYHYWDFPILSVEDLLIPILSCVFLFAILSFVLWLIFTKGART